MCDRDAGDRAKRAAKWLSPAYNSFDKFNISVLGGKVCAIRDNGQQWNFNLEIYCDCCPDGNCPEMTPAPTPVPVPQIDWMDRGAKACKNPFDPETAPFIDASLEGCQTECAKNPDCTAIYGRFDGSHRNCWTYLAACKEEAAWNSHIRLYRKPGAGSSSSSTAPSSTTSVEWIAAGTKACKNPFDEDKIQFMHVSLEGCKAECEKNPECTAIYGRFDGSHKNCWNYLSACEEEDAWNSLIKLYRKSEGDSSSSSTTAPAAEWIAAGNKVCKDFDGKAVIQASLEDCKEKCEKNPECTAVFGRFDGNYKNCWVYTRACEEQDAWNGYLTLYHKKV